MINYQVFSDNEWIYPDTAVGTQNRAELYAARGSDVCFQVLTDKFVCQDETVSFELNGIDAVPELYQLLPAHVCKNSGLKFLVADDYETVRHFVTREAPFDVFEVAKPLDEQSPNLNSGRMAFYVRLNVSYDALPCESEGTLKICIGGESFAVPVWIKIYHAQIPSLADTEFHMINWIYYDKLAAQHNVELWSDEYRRILISYMKNQLDMRSDYLMIPKGRPVLDSSGKVVDFDFTEAEYVGNIALECGYNVILGEFTAANVKYDEPELYLEWNRDIGVTTIEGYRQLKMYFKRAYESAVRCGWVGKYMQCLVDEPQNANALAYRALSGICRRFMPNIAINDPVETADLAGAVDTWVVKQAVYERDIEKFRALQECGEDVWIYTCGFPAGSMMNHVIDLSLNASRLPMWMCSKYGCTGFLHFGYHLHNAEGSGDTNYTASRGRRFPAGNSFVVYNGDGRPWYSVRGHSQRSGAYDYELFRQLGLHDREKAISLIEKVCRGFDDYSSDPKLLDDVRHELLEKLEVCI